MATSTFDEKSSVPVRLYLDFDGTLSGLAGAQTVSSPFYRSLQADGKDYHLTNFIEQKEMVNKIKQEFKDPTNKMKMTEGAVDFLRIMSEAGAEIHIISRNRREYIEAVLEAEGLEPDKLRNIKISDVNGMYRGNKKDEVIRLEEANPRTALHTIICDDSKEDLDRMVAGVTNKTKDKMRYDAGPGNYNWKAITKDIIAKLGVQLDESQKAIRKPVAAASELKERKPVVPHNNNEIRLALIRLLNENKLGQHVTKVVIEGDKIAIHSRQDPEAKSKYAIRDGYIANKDKGLGLNVENVPKQFYFYVKIADLVKNPIVNAKIEELQKTKSQSTMEADFLSADRKEEKGKGTVIFKKMDPAYNFLLGEAWANMKETAWLLRESREAGMLAIDFAFLDKEAKEGPKWVTDSDRLALTRSGWQIAHGADNIARIRKEMSGTAITKENADKFVVNLFSLIEIPNIFKKGLILTSDSRIIPRIEEQSRNEVFSGYNAYIAVDLSQPKKEEKPKPEEHSFSSLVPPPPAFICPLTKQIMRNPVVASNGNIYERDAIRSWLYSHDNQDPSTGEVIDSTIIPNRALESIIEAFKQVEALKQEKLDEKISEKINEKLNVIENELADMFTGDPMEDPVLTVNGYTYEREKIKAWLTEKHKDPKAGNAELTSEALIDNPVLLKIPAQLEEYKKALAAAQESKELKEGKASDKVGVAASAAAQQPDAVPMTGSIAKSSIFDRTAEGKALTEADKLSIARYLNHCHAPFSKQNWKADEKGLYYETLSLNPNPSSVSMFQNTEYNGAKIQAMMNSFGSQEIDAGLTGAIADRFKANLIVDNNAERCIYRLHDPGLLKDILELVRKFEKDHKFSAAPGA